VKHLKKGRKFGRVRNQRKALMKGLVEALVLNEKIKTTEAKAKELRPFVEKLITKSKTKDLTTRRYLDARLPFKSAKKLYDEIGPKYIDRAGGYTRIIKLPPRMGDGAKMAIIELIK